MSNENGCKLQAAAGSKLDAALAWAARGFPCFPLQPNSKLPAIQNWTVAASTDPAVIRAWWLRTDPVVGAVVELDYNIAMLTTDKVVFDVDLKAGKPGLQTFFDLGLDFDTLTNLTPTGGYHLIHQGIGRDVGNAPLGAGLDVRAKNGFVVAPGSTIEVLDGDGEPTACLVDVQPEDRARRVANGAAVRIAIYTVNIDLPVAEVPHAVRPLLRAPRERARRGDVPVGFELDLPENIAIAEHWLRHEAPIAIQGQNGDDTTYKNACQMHDFGVSGHEAVDLMLDVWNERCEPPWPLEELRTIVENAWQYAKGEPGCSSPDALFGDVVDVPPPAPAPPEAAATMRTLSGRDFAARELQPRPWLVEEMIPDRTVTLLSGDGGVGKSILAQQLIVAVAAGRDWLGSATASGRAVYLSAEDDVDEVHRRLLAIATAYGLALDDLDDLHVVPLAGQDAVLAAPDRQSEVMKPTQLWQLLVATVKAIRPRLVVLDNLADVFAGNENSRTQARQFTGMLRGLAIDHGLAVLVISHPSLTGMTTGKGTSGSTAWSNSARSRLYLQRAEGEAGRPADPNLRVLEVMKSNYGPAGERLRIRWRQGFFKVADGAVDEQDRAAADAESEQVFLKILGRLTSEGLNVSPKRSSTYAPAVLEKQPDAEGFRKIDFEPAMYRLLKSGRVTISEHGSPSRRYQRLVAADA